MAKKILKVADKPTLDELKVLLENSGYGLEALKTSIGDIGSSVDEQVKYLKRASTVTTTKKLQTALSISGSGKIYSSKITGPVWGPSSAIFLKITVDGEVLYNAGSYYFNSDNNSSSDTYYNTHGIFAKDFMPNAHNGTYFLNAMSSLQCSTTCTIGDFTNGKVISDQGSRSLCASVFNKPIEFKESFKVEGYGGKEDATVTTVYSLDD